MLRASMIASADVSPAPAAGSGLALREVRDPLELEHLREPWNELYSSLTDATPFQSPEWLIPFAERFAKGALWTLTVWRGPRLVGLAPFTLVPRAEGRTLCFLGAPVTDYHGLLVARGRAGEGVLEAIVEHIAEASAHWDLSDFGQLRPGEPLLSAPFPAGFTSELTDQDDCPYVPLPVSGDELTDGFPHELGARLRRSLRGLRRVGDVAFERADEHSADELLDALFSLHAARWNARNATGVLADQAIQQFHREVAAGMLVRGRLRLWGLRLDDRVEAVVYAFAHGARVYSYLGGFNPALGKWSPGLVTLWSVMLASIEEGMEELDLMRGDEAYKFRFGARVRRTQRRLVRPA
jgi:CelD/BcsL family acetyltransferase involved in cellulose biosynthesis